MDMSENSIEEYTKKMRGRYARMTGKLARGRLLDEFSEVTGWERKHANKVLLGSRRKHGIKQIRSRPYFKNDQAYVEQKNHTHVRQFLGYDRLEHHELLGDLNDLLKLWSTWRNLFCVTMKQESKRREGSRQIRRHEKKGRTPAQRLLDGGELQAGDRKALKEKMIALNPFELREEIRKLENRLWSKRRALYEMEEEESLALAGASPLRSEAPARAKQKRTENKAATVSQL